MKTNNSRSTIKEVELIDVCSSGRKEMTLLDRKSKNTKISAEMRGSGATAEKGRSALASER